MRKLVKMPSVQNCSAGAIATVDLPTGLTYDVFMLKLTNITLAQLTDIELRINGKTVQEFASGTELDQLNTYHGRVAFANGILRLWQIRPELKLPGEQRLTALGTGDVQTLSLSCAIDAACVSPNIEVYAQQSAKTPLGLITKIRAFPRTFATSGKQEIDTIPRSGARIACIHLFKDDISDCQVQVDGREALNATKVILGEVQKDFGKVPQTAAATHIDFIVNGVVEDSLPTQNVQDFRVQPTLDTSGSVRVLVEYLDAFAGI